jgi:hypothetical protein
MSQGEAAGAGAGAWASAAATYAANHATTGEQPIKRDRPIFENAMRHIKQLIQKLPDGGKVNEPIIWDAILYTFKNTSSLGGEGIEIDAPRLCRLVLERTKKDIIKTFRTPNLTDEQIDTISNDSATLGGGRRKKRRSGKKKGKMRKNSRTIKKNGTKNIKQKTLNKKH